MSKWVQTALVSRRSWVRIPSESPVMFFSTDTRKALSIQCYTHVGVRAKLNQLLLLLITYPWDGNCVCHSASIHTTDPLYVRQSDLKNNWQIQRRICFFSIYAPVCMFISLFWLACMFVWPNWTVTDFVLKLNYFWTRKQVHPWPIGSYFNPQTSYTNSRQPRATPCIIAYTKNIRETIVWCTASWCCCRLLRTSLWQFRL